MIYEVNAAERVRLEELAAAGNILLLRDWRYGAIFGTIDGNVAASIETKGFIVSFSFRQCDYGEEITLT